MAYLPEDNIVTVQTNTTDFFQFYKLSINEYTTINGETDRDELTKTIHLSIKKYDYQFQYLVEVFDRVHKNRTLSLSEKDLGVQLSSILDEIKLNVDLDLNLIKIDNFDEIKDKAQQKIKKLFQKYVGENAKTKFEFLSKFYNNEKLIFSDLQRYNQLGLLINKFQGLYRFGRSSKYKIRYLNFLENTLLEVDETMKLIRLNRDIEELEIQLSGVISDNFNKIMFVKEMELQDIIFDHQKDNPTLDVYRGNYVFNSVTGEIKSSKINIEFSFGTNYSKKIEYNLVAVNHEEI